MSLKSSVMVLMMACLLSLSCTRGLGKSSSNQLFQYQSEQFSFTDRAGNFLLTRESGRSSEENYYVVKQSLKSTNSEVLEQSVSYSQMGRLKNQINVMRPWKSQYAVWFDGKRYFSEMEMDLSSRSMIVRMRSPESQWNGESKIPFPEENAVYCFFSALAECASLTGFIEIAKSKKAGSMNFYIIWDGYPYYMQQYPEIPEELFSRAILEYDGDGAENQNRFSLRFAGQTIFLFLGERGRYDRLFWVSQGLSIVKRGKGLSEVRQ